MSAEPTDAAKPEDTVMSSLTRRVMEWAAREAEVPYKVDEPKRPCWNCAGKGFLPFEDYDTLKTLCDTCHGTGIAPKTEPVTIRPEDFDGDFPLSVAPGSSMPVVCINGHKATYRMNSMPYQYLCSEMGCGYDWRRISSDVRDINEQTEPRMPNPDVQPPAPREEPEHESFYVDDNTFGCSCGYRGGHRGMAQHRAEHPSEPLNAESDEDVLHGEVAKPGGSYSKPTSLEERNAKGSAQAEAEMAYDRDHPLEGGELEGLLAEAGSTGAASPDDYDLQSLYAQGRELLAQSYKQGQRDARARAYKRIRVYGQVDGMKDTIAVNRTDYLRGLTEELHDGDK